MSIGTNTAINVTIRREKLYRYVDYDLLPALRSSGRGKLASELEVALGHGPSHLRRLPQESIDQLKETLRLEIDKIELGIKLGKISGDAEDTEMHQMIELLSYLPDHPLDARQTQGASGLLVRLKRALSP